MYYELYIDSLFLMNFVMNLYLLGLVNRSLLHIATRRRVVLGAFLGAMCYLIPFFVGGVVWFVVIVTFIITSIIMIKVTFRVKTWKAFWKVMEQLLLYSFLLGGVLLFVIRLFPQIRKALVSVFGILGFSAIIFLIISYKKEQKKSKHDLCEVVLSRNGVEVKVKALMDTGNGLFEPISGKTVSILEQRVFDNLYPEGKPEGYRAIPYHSIGKKRGILEGYLIPKMSIEMDGVMKQCQNIYVGIGEEEVASLGEYEMILNPQVLNEN